MNLNLCLAKATTLSDIDEKLLKRLTADYQADGMMSPDAASRALTEVKRLAYADRNEVISDISVKGGVIPAGTPVLFSPVDQKTLDQFKQAAASGKPATMGDNLNAGQATKQKRRPRSRDNGSSLADSVRRDGATGIPINDAGRVPLTHWGAVKDLTELDPGFWGTAAAGQEARLAGDPNFRNRVYFGLPGYVVESNVNTVANARYFATLDPKDLYRWEDDPDGIRVRIKADNPDLPASLQALLMEGAVVDAGYKGYWGAHPSGPIAVVFEAIGVEQAPRYHGANKEPGTPLTVAGVDPDGNLPEVDTKLSPRRQRTFYSELTSQVETLKQPKAPGGQWKAMINKLPKIKKSEIEWSGVMEWLDDMEGSVTRDEIVEYLKAHEVQLEEVTKSGHLTNEDILEKNGYRVVQVSADLRERFDTFGHLGDYDAVDVDGVLRLEDRDTFATDNSDPDGYGIVDRYDMPQSTSESRRDVIENAPMDLSHWDELESEARITEPDQETKFESWQMDGGKNYTELLMTMPAGSTDYKSPHWNEKNVLVHARYNDRVVDGQNTLFIEEIQSDWHQAGRAQSYGTDSVPDAPMKSTDQWAMLGFKRMLRHAVEKGYERIAWTPGEEQVRRYNHQWIKSNGRKRLEVYE